MMRRTLSLFAVCTITAVAYACGDAKPATPVAPTPPENAASDGSTLKASAPSAQSPNNNEKINTAVVVLTAGASTLQYESATPVTLQYRFQVMSPSGAVVDNALVSGTTYEVAATLADDTRHTWRVRAEAEGQGGPWSSTASFVTRDPALVVDPLVNGRTVGRQLGGTFVSGQGWMALNLGDAIDYDIPTCDNCTVEFDITNIGPGEGYSFQRDLKFLSMGDADFFGGFGPFRDHDWKMHLVQRADGDGTGLEIIWRNGGRDPVGNPGDHRIKMTCCGPDFQNSSVFHFVVRWTPGGYNISVGTNGGPQVEYLADGFGGLAYAPPNHRVQLGCAPREETIPNSIYRNVRIYRNR